MMTLATMILVLTTALILALAVREAHRQERALGRLSRSLVAAESPVKRRRFDWIEADNRRRLLRQSVEEGASAVEVVHRLVTTTTFEAIDRLAPNDVVRQRSQRAREIHDGTSRTVYRSIRVANRHVHALANVIIGMNRGRPRRPRDKR
ncbi:hypothetical protein [Marinobacter bohaiensis]|uniref:hypothetical protein n=1 Tax=Marinobacter bohaiensis TaxID=2201898 RepID=UPI000DAE01D8|nr:hypothetical protein [Marinobacter bohaiensis]